MAEDIKQYAYSLDEEYYEGSFDTPEEAAAAGFDDGNCEPHAPVFVGEIVHPDPVGFVPHFDSIIERMQEAAQEEHGEFADCYLDGISRETIQEMNKDFSIFVMSLLENNGVNIIPSFFTVQNTVTFQNPDPIQDERAKC